MKALLSSAAKDKRYTRRLFSYRFRIILFLFIYPYLVGFSSDSTGVSGNLIEILVGTEGHSHVTYDCSGNVTGITNYSTVDYGISATHNEGAFKFGGRAGGYTVLNQARSSSSYYGSSDLTGTNDNTALYVNPFIGVENKYFDVNIGAVIFTNNGSSGSESMYMYIPDIPGHVDEFLISDGNIQPSWVIRIGNIEKFHFSTQYLSNVPLLSGGGMFDMGFGFGSTENRNLTWVGTSAGPFQNIGFTIKQNIQVSGNIDILIRGRVGIIEDNFEGGISAGLRMSM